MRKKITIIGVTPSTLEECFKGWEYDYIINDLFNKFDLEIKIIWENLDLFIENSLIIYSSDERRLSEKLLNYFDEYKRKNMKFNLFHISNEQLNHDCSYYDLANIVIRNYFDPTLKKENIITVPLGYKGGVINKNKTYLKYSEKKYDFCFIGQLKNDRIDVIGNIQKYDRKFIHITNKWDCPTSLSSTEMSKIYSQTFLIPCPMGNVNLDSFRICEVLESGSIPVLKKYNGIDYFSNIFGKNPLPIVNSWGELDIVYKTLMINPDEKIFEINNWYIIFKENLRNKIYNIF